MTKIVQHVRLNLFGARAFRDAFVKLTKCVCTNGHAQVYNIRQKVNMPGTPSVDSIISNVIKVCKSESKRKTLRTILCNPVKRAYDLLGLSR